MKSQTLDMAYRVLGMKWSQPLSTIQYTLESAWNILFQAFCLLRPLSLKLNVNFGHLFPLYDLPPTYTFLYIILIQFVIRDLFEYQPIIYVPIRSRVPRSRDHVCIIVVGVSFSPQDIPGQANALPILGTK